MVRDGDHVKIPLNQGLIPDFEDLADLDFLQIIRGFLFLDRLCFLEIYNNLYHTISIYIMSLEWKGEGVPAEG